MATTNTRYVDPNSTAGGDGTTNALAGANRAYVSLTAWEAARQADLPTGDIIERCVCSSDDAGSTHAAETPSDTIIIDGWTTDATRYIQIEAATTHGGRWNDNIYRIIRTGDSINTIRFREDFVRFIGIQAKFVGNGSTVFDDGFSTGLSAGARVIFDKCILTASGQSTNGGVGVYLYKGSSSAYVNVRNSLLYNFKKTSGTNGNAIAVDGGGVCEKVYAYNATIYNCDRYFYGNTTTTVQYTNVINSGSGSGSITTTTCVDSTFVSFVDAANGDFRLSPPDADSINAGTDLTSDATFPFSDDIFGNTRPTGAGTWDIGMHEYIAPAGTYIHGIMRHHFIPPLLGRG